MARKKGPGFFGTLQRPDGKVSTELSIGVGFDGEETEIPLISRNQSRASIDSFLAGNPPTDEEIQTAVNDAKKRLKAGKSPFAQRGEQVGLPQSRGTSMARNAAGFLQAEDGSFLVADSDTGQIVRTNERPNIVPAAQRSFFKPTPIGSRLTGAMKSRIDQEVDAEAAAVRSNLLSSARNLEETDTIRAFLDKNDLASRTAVAQEKQERKKKAIFKATQMQEALQSGSNITKLSDRVDKLTLKLGGFGTDRKGNVVTIDSKGKKTLASPSEKILHRGLVTELALKIDQLAQEEQRARPFAGQLDIADQVKIKSPLAKFLDRLLSDFAPAPIIPGDSQVSAPTPDAVSPFPSFPDAFVESGKWIVIRDGQKFEVVQ